MSTETKKLMPYEYYDIARKIVGEALEKYKKELQEKITDEENAHKALLLARKQAHQKMQELRLKYAASDNDTSKRELAEVKEALKPELIKLKNEVKEALNNYNTLKKINEYQHIKDDWNTVKDLTPGDFKLDRDYVAAWDGMLILWHTNDECDVYGTGASPYILDLSDRNKGTDTYGADHSYTIATDAKTGCSVITYNPILGKALQIDRERYLGQGNPFMWLDGECYYLTDGTVLKNERPTPEEPRRFKTYRSNNKVYGSDGPFRDFHTYNEGNLSDNDKEQLNNPDRCISRLNNIIHNSKSGSDFINEHYSLQSVNEAFSIAQKAVNEAKNKGIDLEKLSSISTQIDKMRNDFNKNFPFMDLLTKANCADATRGVDYMVIDIGSSLTLANSRVPCDDNRSVIEKRLIPFGDQGDGYQLGLTIGTPACGRNDSVGFIYDGCNLMMTTNMRLYAELKHGMKKNYQNLQQIKNVPDICKCGVQLFKVNGYGYSDSIEYNCDMFGRTGICPLDINHQLTEQQLIGLTGYVLEGKYPGFEGVKGIPTWPRLNGFPPERVYGVVHEALKQLGANVAQSPRPPCNYR